MDYHGSYYGQNHDPYSGYQYSSDNHRSRYGQYEQCYETSSDNYCYSRCDVQGHGPRHQHDHDVSPVQHSSPHYVEYGGFRQHSSNWDVSTHHVSPSHPPVVKKEPTTPP